MWRWTESVADVAGEAKPPPSGVVMRDEISANCYDR
jgi:hypothetical protein